VRWRSQFAVAVLGLVTVVMLLKMPSGDVGRLAFKLLDVVHKTAALGYVLALASSVIISDSGRATGIDSQPLRSEVIRGDDA
jgi:hypothetical protein